METETIEKDLKEEINDYIELLKEELQERDIDDLRHDDPHDVIFDWVDSLWGSIQGTGRIDRMEPAPGSVRGLNDLIRSCLILQMGQADEWPGWIAEDRGLWEGIEGQGVMHSQAFFTLRNIISEGVKEQLEETDPERAEAFFY